MLRNPEKISYDEFSKLGHGMDDMLACDFCKHYDEKWAKNDPILLCQNIKSPHYSGEYYSPSSRVNDLDWINRLKGCDFFGHNGKKMPLSVFRTIHAESPLRVSVDPVEIIDDFVEGDDIMPYITFADIRDVLLYCEAWDHCLISHSKREEGDPGIIGLRFIDGVLNFYDAGRGVIFNKAFGNMLKK